MNIVPTNQAGASDSILGSKKLVVPVSNRKINDTLCNYAHHSGLIFGENE